MSPFGFWGLPAALLALLYCPGSGEKAPEQVAVKRGEPYKVNCTSSCPHPQIRGLETTLNKVELQKHAQWTEYLVSNVSQDTVMYCHFTCSGKQMSKTISVRVFHPPEQVLLELQPARVTVGRPFTIVCSVPAVAPLEKLTLTLLHGKKPLHTQTFGSGKDDPQEATATHNATAHKEDGHHNFSCRAELDLRSLGGDIISSVSEARALQVYEPMQDNQMVIITVVSVLLFLFVTSVLLCFIFGQQWHQRQRRTYRVQEAWRTLRRTWAQPT
ncbi:intercellular adhesion molecule 2 isoform X2 [Pteropus medius]|uniref:intercellular adhesion molecule 2 isoform X2 n=1 Tax=Pteropus vampyrus TaxID=132908 RepID=UPI00196AE486|nr:intercellular adhesion molecule 2 isoform X2 [Pteropus giganteus]